MTTSTKKYFRVALLILISVSTLTAQTSLINPVPSLPQKSFQQKIISQATEVDSSASTIVSIDTTGLTEINGFYYDLSNCYVIGQVLWFDPSLPFHEPIPDLKVQRKFYEAAGTIPIMPCLIPFPTGVSLEDVKCK